MPPKVNGSSTIGGKKSTVCTMAISAVSLYTPASSAVSNPISTFSSGQRGILAKTRSSNLGLNFAAQPAAFTFAVNFLSWVVFSMSGPTIIASMRKMLLLAAVLLFALAAALISGDPRVDARIRKASRAPERNGWIQVHLEGSPSDIGFQHGYLLSAEIQDTVTTIATELKHDDNKDWDFYRKTAREVFWPHIEAQYRDELNGIAAGLKA